MRYSLARARVNRRTADNEQTERTMKKLLILLPVLIIITAVVFYFGWIQLKVRSYAPNGEN